MTRARAAAVAEPVIEYAGDFDGQIILGERRTSCTVPSHRRTDWRAFVHLAKLLQPRPPLDTCSGPCVTNWAHSVGVSDRPSPRRSAQQGSAE
jgi:hypothetical protein